MQNVQNIILDKEFQSMLPELDKETYKLLEESLIEHGCRDALVVWQGILIDGYNRFRICTEHDITFATVEMEFDSRENVLIWIISNQVARRNLTQMQLCWFRGLHYRAEKRIVKNASGINQYSEVNRQNVDKPKSTARRLSELYRVSSKTIERDRKVADTIDAIGEISPDIQRKILSGEVEINKKKLEGLSSGSMQEIEAIVAEIEAGTYERRAHSAPVSVTAGSIGKSAYLTDLDPEEATHLATAVNNVTNGYLFLLRKYNDGDLAQLKTALYSYIDALEYLLRRL